MNQFQPVVDEEVEESVDLFEEEDALDDADTEQPDEVEVEETVDPLAELRAQVESYKPLADLNPAQVKSALGRIAALQSSLDKLQSKDPTADIAPKLEAIESYVEMLAEAVLSSDFMADDGKQRIQTARAQRQRERDRNELLAEMRREAGQGNQPQSMSPEDALWAMATQDVVTEAQSLGFDPNTIPVDVWLEGRALGTPFAATRHVLNWMKSQQDQEEAPPQRVAARKTAAGKGSPPPTGGASMSDDDLWDDYGMNPDKYTSAEALGKVRAAGKRLGYLND